MDRVATRTAGQAGGGFRHQGRRLQRTSRHDYIRGPIPFNLATQSRESFQPPRSTRGTVCAERVFSGLLLEYAKVLVTLGSAAAGATGGPRLMQNEAGAAPTGVSSPPFFQRQTVEGCRPRRSPSHTRSLCAHSRWPISPSPEQHPVE